MLFVLLLMISFKARNGYLNVIIFVYFCHIFIFCFYPTKKTKTQTKTVFLKFANYILKEIRLLIILYNIIK